MKSYAVKNDSSIYCNTGLIGYVHITYAELVKEFGKPNDHSTKKSTDVLWVLHGTVKGKLVVATVYVYKENKPKEELTKWHIGGHGDGTECFKLIQSIFPDKKVQTFFESQTELCEKIFGESEK